MEIERKFLIEEFPPCTAGLSVYLMRQGYLSTHPVVRLRQTVSPAGEKDYKLCIKGGGTLVREEVELPLTAGEYERLCALLPMPPVEKQHIRCPLPDGHVLECNLVDGNFYYAEVEFSSVEEARAFAPPDFLGREVTEEPGHSMSSYWKKKLESKERDV